MWLTGFAGRDYSAATAPARGLDRRFEPLLEALHHDEERRHEQHGQAGRGEHAAEHGNAERGPRIGAGAGRQSPAAATPRMNANDVIRIGPEARRAPPSTAAIGDWPCPRQAQFARELDDQDRVLGADSAISSIDADLGIEIVGERRGLPAPPPARPATVGTAQNHRERPQPAFVLAGEQPDRPAAAPSRKRRSSDCRPGSPDTTGRSIPSPVLGGNDCVGDLVHQLHGLA